MLTAGVWMVFPQAVITDNRKKERACLCRHLIRFAMRIHPAAR